MKCGRVEVIYATVFMVITFFFLCWALSFHKVYSQEITFDMLPIPVGQKVYTIDIDPDAAEANIYTVSLSVDSDPLSMLNVPAPNASTYEVIEKIIFQYLDQIEAEKALEEEDTYIEVIDDQDDDELESILSRETYTSVQIQQEVYIKMSDELFTAKEIVQDDEQLKILDKDNLVTCEEK